MSVSAHNRVSEAETLTDTLELYRDLSAALRDRIEVLKSDRPSQDGCRSSIDTIQAHYKALHFLLELEDSIGRETLEKKEGSVEQLDLESARAEIAQRLSVWTSRS